MTLHHFAAALLVAATASAARSNAAYAQSQNGGCPVQITGINPSGDNSFGHAFTHNSGNAP